MLTRMPCALRTRSRSGADKYRRHLPLDAGMIERPGHLEHLPIQLLLLKMSATWSAAEFDLGEDIRVVVLSTTEGHDKVLKYPLVFQQPRW